MDKLISDRAQVEISKKVKDILRAYRIEDYQSEPHHQHQNFAENRYSTIKRWVNTIMNRTHAEPGLWLLCLTYVCYLLNRVASPALKGITPLQALTGSVPDITPLLAYQFNQPVYFTDRNPPKPTQRRGRWVGFSQNVGNPLTWIVLADDTRKLFYTSYVRPVKDSGLSWPTGGEEDSKNHTIFIRGRFEANGPADIESLPRMPTFDPTDLIGRTFLQPKEQDGTRHHARVLKIIKELETDNESGHIDCIRVLIGIDKGESKIEEIISYQQLLDYIERSENDAEEELFRFKAIIGHQGPLKDGDPGYKGSRYNVQVEWETGEITYEPLSIIARDDPITCAVYAKKHDLLDQQGWKHLKRFTRTQKAMVRAIKQARLRQVRYAQRFKFGYEIPKNYKDAICIDQQNGNSKFQDAIDKEIAQLAEYETFRDEGKAKWIAGNKLANAPQGFHKIRVHFVFDVKHDGRHKARLVAGGHLTPDPVEDVYSGVVSLRSLCLVAFLAELNDLELWGADIGNAYLEAYTEEKVFFVPGPEFGDQEGHIMVIVKALYGLKSSGKRFWERLHDDLKSLGFKPSRADPQVWMRPTEDGDAYEYIATYVDDLAIAAKDCQALCENLKSQCGYKLKGDGPLTYHLGCDYIREPDGTLLATPKQYVAKILEWYEKRYGEKPRKRRNPLEPNDHPELDTSPLATPEETKDVQTMIGQLQWLVALGRFDVHAATTTMARFRTAPRKEHVTRCKNIYGYLAMHAAGGIRYRVGEPDLSNLPNQVHDWSRSCYGDVKESIPDDAPIPRGRYVVIMTYTDANLLHDQATGRALTAVLHFINQTPIDWYSKRQATVETATYGSEFVAARTAIDQIIDLRYTLRYLGVPI